MRINSEKLSNIHSMPCHDCQRRGLLSLVLCGVQAACLLWPQSPSSGAYTGRCPMCRRPASSRRVSIGFPPCQALPPWQTSARVDPLFPSTPSVTDSQCVLTSCRGMPSTRHSCISATGTMLSPLLAPGEGPCRRQAKSAELCPGPAQVLEQPGCCPWSMGRRR